jgi:PST family polysaccharide transporter
MIGGSTGINAVISMGRAKAGALFLGPEGIGLMGLFYNLFAMLGTVFGMGINNSGVKQVAQAVGLNHPEKVGRTIRVLRSVCWFTGMLGLLSTAVFSSYISTWVFGDGQYTLSIAVASSILLLNSVSNGQLALIQGMRRIADLAKLSILKTFIGTLAAVLCFWSMGKDGIVPSIILGSVIGLFFSWWFARKIPVPDCDDLNVSSTVRESKALMTLGFAFMWAGSLAAAAVLIRSSLVANHLGLEATGFYNAAWSITMIFSQLILGAMGADYFPRLASMSHDHESMRRLVHEQTEIAILIMLPALVGVLSFAPLAIQLFYSADFLPAAGLLQWFVLGILGRALAWPMGYISVALGKSRLFAITDTISILCHLGLSAFLLFKIGLVGIPIAFFIHHILYTLAMTVIANRLIAYSWSKSALLLVAQATALVGISFLIRNSFEEITAFIIGIGLVAITGIFCLRGLMSRLGGDHKIIKLARRIPGMNLMRKRGKRDPR